MKFWERLVSMGPRQSRLRAAMAEPFPAAWERWLRTTWPAWRRFEDADRDLLRQLIQGFHVTIEVEGARDFPVNPSMSVIIAAQASQLLLGLARTQGPVAAMDAYRDVRTVVVHPSTVVLGGEHPTATPRVMTTEPRHLLGQAQLHGPVLLAWDEVRRGLADLHRGNVVLHEFAHKLDMGGGSVDGTPALGTGQERRAWFEAATRTLDNIRRRRDPVLRAYGAQNPAEFFAVATEAFFGQPDALEEHHPELFASLVGLYEQRPAQSPESIVFANAT